MVGLAVNRVPEAIHESIVPKFLKHRRDENSNGDNKDGNEQSGLGHFLEIHEKHSKSKYGEHSSDDE